MQFSSSQGCRGGADAALPDPALARGTDAALNEPPPLARRASIPRACNAAPAPVATPVVAQPFLPATPPGGGGGATTQAEEAPALCEADFVGATASSHHAQCVLGVKVEMIFGQRPYAGTVVSWEAFPEFGRRIQHVVLFEDGTKGDYSW